jgi:hypothetical protein
VVCVLNKLRERFVIKSGQLARECKQNLFFSFSSNAYFALSLFLNLFFYAPHCALPNCAHTHCNSACAKSRKPPARSLAPLCQQRRRHWKLYVSRLPAPNAQRKVCSLNPKARSLQARRSGPTRGRIDAHARAAGHDWPEVCRLYTTATKARAAPLTTLCVAQHTGFVGGACDSAARYTNNKTSESGCISLTTAFHSMGLRRERCTICARVPLSLRSVGVVSSSSSRQARRNVVVFLPHR